MHCVQWWCESGSWLVTRDSGGVLWLQVMSGARWCDRTPVQGLPTGEQLQVKYEPTVKVQHGSLSTLHLLFSSSTRTTASPVLSHKCRPGIGYQPTMRRVDWVLSAG